MHQQINLFQPIFSEARQALSSRSFLLGFAVVIAGLVGYSVYANSRLSALRASVETLRTQQIDQETLLTATGEASAAREKPAVVEARVRMLEGMIAGRRSALAVLESGAAGQTTGFAARMEALARRHVEGLWIDKLVLSGTNGAMSLGGATLDADTVPIYLRSLAQERVLSGTRFDEFMIERPKQVSAPALATEEDAEGKPVKHRAAAPAHVRFRAGSTNLTAPAIDVEAAT
jgi:hypothetical protein